MYPRLCTDAASSSSARGGAGGGGGGGVDDVVVVVAVAAEDNAKKKCCAIEDASSVCSANTTRKATIITQPTMLKVDIIRRVRRFEKITIYACICHGLVVWSEKKRTPPQQQ